MLKKHHTVRLEKGEEAGPHLQREAGLGNSKQQL